ncbi:MAG: glutathione transferase GstA [Cycloclasticus sp.]|nr:glutathione transferase GstA [Cycloclasticus sp.]MBG96660.1 glutathione transferase GstA [Cycloclasticus sp.]HAI97229.1 glutathione transferase GstA [Methylococcaceae bacterium]|tara:strand:- start:961 stop:1566 length:606 start_codon:yes stop_codon:yes gene_type:complete
MKLYYSPASCSLSPHITLCETGLDCELVKVDLATHTLENGDNYLDINPHGYVPALVLDNGESLFEGPAIIQYLADLAPEKNLVPAAGSFERAKVQQWLNFLSTELHKQLAPLFNPALPDEAKGVFIEGYSNRLNQLANALGDNDYLLGDQYSIADIYLFVILSWHPFFEFDASPWPTLEAFQARVGARPAVQQALKEEGLA